MSSKNSENKNDLSILYNTLISLRLISEHLHYHHHDKYLVRMDDLEQRLKFKLCKSPLLEYYDLKESFFFIRDIDECQSIYGHKKSDNSFNSQYFEQYNSLKETGFSNNSKLNFNHTFYLQHMMSKKFITMEKIQGNNSHTLKLVSEVERAVPFSFKKINETRSSIESLSYKNIVYLSIYDKEKGQFYFVSSAISAKNNPELNEESNNNSEYEKEGLNKEKKGKSSFSDYTDLCVENNARDKFSIINQSWYISNKDCLYSGQLINIVFTNAKEEEKEKMISSDMKNKENEKMMLSALGDEVENKIEEIIGIKEEVREDIDGMIRDNNQKFIQFYGATDRIKEKRNSFSSIKIKGLPYDEKYLFEHVVNNSFWVIEKENSGKGDYFEREPIQIGDLVRIKNPLLGLYLIIKKKEKEQKNNSEIVENININNNNVSGKNSNIFNNNITNLNNNTITINNNVEEDEYEFELVDLEVLEKGYFNYNFKFFHYNASEEKYMGKDGKYGLKGVFKEINEINRLIDVKEEEAYFEPCFLYNGKDSVNIKIEDDHILDIRKIDIYEGNQVIYIQNVITDLDSSLKKIKKKKTSANSVIKKITLNVNFFMEYLLNIDSTFKNDNYEINHPIKERQLLLDKFNVLKTILEIINYFLPTVKDIKIRDSSKLKRVNNIYNNRGRIKESLNINMPKNTNNDEESKISNMSSMLKLILKFLIYLSESNEDIKQKIFIKLQFILEFSEFIYNKDRSVLLDFIFDLLNDSESLQECILTGKLKLTEKNQNENLKHEKVLHIDIRIEKILAYIETSYNYLFYYKKLMNLNKIGYKVEEIKEKINSHMKQVSEDYRTKRKKAKNYKSKISNALRQVKLKVLNQIKDWNDFIEEKQRQDKLKENSRNQELKRGKTSLLEEKKNSRDNSDLKHDSRFKSEKKLLFSSIIKEEDSSRSSKRDLKDSERFSMDENAKVNENKNINNDRDEDNNFEAESNVNLNNKLPFQFPLKMIKSSILNKKNFFNNDNSNNNINASGDQNISNNFISDKTKSLENDKSNLYSDKRIDDNLEATANTKISNLKLVLSFLRYFKAIDLNKSLFMKDIFFKEIFKKDINEEYLENNLNYIINGERCSLNFIKNVEFNSDSRMGPLLPLRLYNLFFPRIVEKPEEFDTKNIINEMEEENSVDDESVDDEEEENSYERDTKTRGFNDPRNNLFFDKDDDEEEESKEDEGNEESEEEEDKENEEDEKESEEEKKVEKPLKQSAFNASNFSKRKPKIGSVKFKEEEKDNKKENNFPKYRKSIRKSIKHHTVNLYAKTVYFESKLKKTFNNEEQKKSKYQKIKEKSKEEDKKINDNLYKLYSIYQFCINEYMEILYKTYKMLFNYCVNYNNFSNMNLVKMSLDYIKEELLPRVVFINNTFLEKLYLDIRKNPTLLTNNFSIENFFKVDDNKNNNNPNDNDNENDDDVTNNINENNENDNKNNNVSGNNKDNRFLTNGNEFKKLKELTGEEIVMVDFLIFYCKKNDQINYLIDKIECFKKIRELFAEIDQKENNKEEEVKEENLFSKIIKKEKNNKNNPKENKEENKLENELKKIIEKLVKNRYENLILYEKLNDVKNQFLYSNKTFLISNNYEDYGIGKQADFMIELLELYEVENFFKKIIYLDIKNNSIYHDKNSFEKLMNIQEIFKKIEDEIQKAKEENEENQDNNSREEISIMNDTGYSPRKLIKENKTHENHYKIINNKLMTMNKNNLNIFSTKEMKVDGENKFIQIFKKENENFFEIIGFADTLKIMVDSIELYDEKKRENNTDESEDIYILKLNYCKEILRAFIEVQAVFPKFNKLVPENFEIYQKMIVSSLKSVKDFHGKDDQNKSEEEKLFLCICYYSSQSLLFLLKNSKKEFSKVEEFTEEVFRKLKDIYEYFHNVKNKVICLIFYNYIVTRVLILLNKERNYDSYKYEKFFNKIYPTQEMGKRILDCKNKLQKDEENDDEIEDEEENEDEESKENKNDDEDEKNNSFRDKLYENKDESSDSEEKSSKNNLGNLLKRKNKVSNDDNFGFNNSNIKDKNIWESDDEKEKLTFFLYFSSIYIIYINEKNSVNDNNFYDENHSDISVFNFRALEDKIRGLLENNDDYKNNLYLDNFYDDNKRLFEKDSSMNSFRSSFINIRETNKVRNYGEENNTSIINNKFITENHRNNLNTTHNNITHKTPNYNYNDVTPKSQNNINFELILLKSIAGFIYTLKNKNVEIPIKKNVNKEDHIYNNETNNLTSNLSEDEKEQEVVRTNDTKLITFYYYEPKYLDIILLEKIFKDIEIKDNLKYYCTNSYTNEEYESLEKSNLLNELLKLQKKFDSINTERKKEYEKLHKLFRENDMERFIKKMFRHFHVDDIKCIDIMQNFIYSKMNEIYPHERVYSSESEKILSLVKTLRNYEDEIQREYLKLDNEILKKTKTNLNKTMNLEQIDLFTFFNSLIYLYPKYNKKLCLIFFKMGFQLLEAKYSAENADNSEQQSNKNNEKIKSGDAQLNLYAMLNGIILLFSRKKNQELINESKSLFVIILNSISLFLKRILENHTFISKNTELIKKLFDTLSFVLKHLLNDFGEIVNFMESPESQQKTNKYKKMEKLLTALITFVKTLIGYKKKNKNILTNEIIEFSQQIVEKIIKLISKLLETSQESYFETIELLLNFIYYFIDGPDIDNLNTLFMNKYFDLVSYVIKEIDYYKLFKSNINKENLNEIINKVIEIEYRIIKIFFIYYNICYHENKNIEEYTQLSLWYKDNIQSIKYKLKRIYYLSKKEMENREYNIDEMLLFLKEKKDERDSYTDDELKKRVGEEYNLNNDNNLDDLEDDIYEENNNDNNNINENNGYVNTGIIGGNTNDNKNEIKEKEKKKENKNEKKEKEKENESKNTKKIEKINKDEPLIKFDLILLYYTLYIYHQDSINEGYLSVPKKRNLLRIIGNFFIDCYFFIKNVVLMLYYLVEYIYRHSTKKKKLAIELLQELSDIDVKCQSVNEKEMFQFLTSRIKCVEVSLNYILYKIYFPLLNKAKQIQDYSEIYLKVDNSKLTNFVNEILNSYDKINIKATQHCKIDKLIEIPIVNILFKSDSLFSFLLILIGIALNILIMMSYSTFTTDKCDDASNDSPYTIRLQCPHFLYKETYSSAKIKKIFGIMGCFLLLFQLILFLGYIIRRFFENIGIYLFSYKKKKLSKKSQIKEKAYIYKKKKEDKISCFSYFLIFLHVLFKIIFNFQTIYYILSLLFIYFGLFIHPFFFCFILLELVNRVEIMQTVLNAMYKPMGNIVITLLMFLMLEYVFSMFAISIYTSHFPIVGDSRTFLKTFMRMLDQTFKQDGGIGTYLSQKQEPGYTPYIAKSYVGSRYFFDLLFFILINQLIFQMFLSMIIDYFNNTKENNEEFQKLKESKCLICEKEREDLEKLYSNMKNAFDLHTNHFHNLIDYIAYLIYLQSLKLKDPIIDNSVWEMHLSNILKYLPKDICFKDIEKKIEKEMLESNFNED